MVKYSQKPENKKHFHLLQKKKQIYSEILQSGVTLMTFFLVSRKFDNAFFRNNNGSILKSRKPYCTNDQ